MRLVPSTTATSRRVCWGSLLPDSSAQSALSEKKLQGAAEGRAWGWWWLPEHQRSIPKAQGNEVTVGSQGAVPPPQQQAILGGCLKPHEGI